MNDLPSGPRDRTHRDVASIVVVGPWPAILLRLVVHFQRFGRHALLFAQPAPQVDLAAAIAAEGQGLRFGPFERFVASRTTHAGHRPRHAGGALDPNYSELFEPRDFDSPLAEPPDLDPSLDFDSLDFVPLELASLGLLSPDLPSDLLSPDDLSALAAFLYESLR